LKNGNASASHRNDALGCWSASESARTTINRVFQTGLHSSLLFGKNTRGQTFDLDSDALFPGFRQHRPLNLDTLEPRDLVFVHLTNFLRCDSTLRSHGQAAFKPELPRDTVHFAVNHAVQDHGLGKWQGRKFGIFIPGATMWRHNGKPLGGNEIDLFWGGNNNINFNKVVVVIQHDSIEPGKLKVIEPSDVGYIDWPHGYLLLASREYPSKIANRVITKMGFTPQPGGGITWDESTDFFKPETLEQVSDEALARTNQFRRFLQRQGIHDVFHSFTPLGALSYMFILMRVLKDQWIIPTAYRNYGEQDMRKILLTALEGIQTDLQRWPQYRKAVPLDLERLKVIIQESETPLEAKERIADKLGFHIPTEEYNPFHPEKPLEPLSIGQFADELLKYSPTTKMVASKAKELSEKEQWTRQDLMLWKELLLKVSES
jgi:hypothetical protein